MANVVRYYFLAPTWHHHPVSGSLQLGNVITTLKTPEQPVHRGPPPPQPKVLDGPPEPRSEEQTQSWQTNYEFSIEKLRAGKFGIWTKFLSFLGIGVDLGYEWDNSKADKYTFQRLVTTEFFPSDEYIRKCLESPSVTRLIARRKSVFYIITGIKAVTGAKANSSANNKSKFKAGVEVDATAVSAVPVSVGPEFENTRGNKEEVAWDGSSDFVLAYRVQKVTVSKKSGEAAHKDYKDGAMLGKETEKYVITADKTFIVSGLEESEITDGGFTVEGDEEGSVCARPPSSSADSGN